MQQELRLAAAKFLAENNRLATKDELFIQCVKSNDVTAAKKAIHLARVYDKDTVDYMNTSIMEYVNDVCSQPFDQNKMLMLRFLSEEKYFVDLSQDELASFVIKNKSYQDVFFPLMRQETKDVVETYLLHKQQQPPTHSVILHKFMMMVILMTFSALSGTSVLFAAFDLLLVIIPTYLVTAGVSACAFSLYAGHTSSRVRENVNNYLTYLLYGVGLTTVVFPSLPLIFFLRAHFTDAFSYYVTSTCALIYILIVVESFKEIRTSEIFYLNKMAHMIKAK